MAKKHAVTRLPTTLRLLRSSLDRASKLARKAAKNDGQEICGLLIDNGYFLELIHVKNKSKRWGSFAFYRKEIRAIQKMVPRLDHEIVGTFHSHPFSNAEPGKNDIKYARDDSLMLIFDVWDKKHALWHIQDNKAKKVRFISI